MCKAEDKSFPAVPTSPKATIVSISGEGYTNFSI